MNFQKVVDRLYQLSLGPVNCFLLEAATGLVLVDTGLPSHGEIILEALDGRPITAIVLTHAHCDHAGSAAFLAQATGAPVWCHPLDADLLKDGKCWRPLSPPPGKLNRYLYNKFVRNGLREIPACRVVERFPVPELEVVPTPGHSLGHVAFLWSEVSTLIVGDAAANVGWLRPGPAYEDYELALKSLRTLGDYQFERAVFGHGGAITRGASRRFRARFGGTKRNQVPK